MPTEKRWTGDLPTTCDIGQYVTHNPHPITDEGFVDGATVFGPWSLMCLPCHREHGVGLGTGRGQRYDATGLKVEG